MSSKQLSNEHWYTSNKININTEDWNNFELQYADNLPTFHDYDTYNRQDHYQNHQHHEHRDRRHPEHRDRRHHEHRDRHHHHHHHSPRKPKIHNQQKSNEKSVQYIDPSNQQSIINFNNLNMNHLPNVIPDAFYNENQHTQHVNDNVPKKRKKKVTRKNVEIINDSMNDLNELVSSLGEKERVNQGHVYVQDGNVDYTSGHNETEKQRVAQPPVVEENKQVTSEAEKLGTDEAPIIEYAEEPLLPLVDACAPLIDILHDLSVYVNMALEETPEEPPDGLTFNESAAIRLYTIEWTSPHRSLYSMLNYTLKNCSREELRPYFKYMKLFLTALVKLPCSPSLTVWRGVTKNLSAEFPPGTPVTWWSFSSTTTELSVLENTMYLGTTGARTLFSVEAINGRTIRAHSHFVTEDEILLLPGTHMIVQSQFSPASDLYIIHLKQVIPNETLLQPPFEGACLYPKNTRPWYRKKRIVIPLALLVTMCIVATVIGAILGTRAANKEPPYVFINPFSSSTISDIDGSPASLVYGHFNSDKYIDLAILNYGGQSIDILVGNANGNYLTPTTADTGLGPVFVTLCTLGGNKTRYLIVVNKEDGTISVLEINEDGTLDFQMYYAVGNEPISALCGDFDNNSVIDVAVLNRYQYDVGTDPISMISADFNNDLKLDLVLVNQGGNNIGVLIGDIDGNFQTPVMYDVGKQPTFVVLGDFNNDTKLDLAVSNNGSTFISVLFGNENGTFQTQVPCEVGNGTNTVAVADLNNDGILDLVATILGESNVIVLFGNRNGSFQGGVKYQISTNSTAMIAADFNNDSRPDLALTNMDDNTISILINYGNGTFQSQVKAHGILW
ncbi:unnamed protein product [Rotaria sordida]|uniref:NAD(P)(+)--arginine ADP-ribosyltransferase n=1 Tax=Rotaria sordida TaxID=392033 RepID=A0A813UAJ4_9BILA|nr:unnamed protein product [Rotaria sordida]